MAARPNFVKMGPVIAALAGRGLEQSIVHAGQHYDQRLSGGILDDLGFPEPDRFLGVGSGTHAEQTARTMVGVEAALRELDAGLLVVAGDVNATLGAAIAASKALVPVVHVESGLRSGDWSMPEEVNRVLTDRVSSLLLTHSPEARTNLLAEGIDGARIRDVGNTMIDTLYRLEDAARGRGVAQALGLPPGAYVLVTLHRPSNVDDARSLAAIVEGLLDLAARHPVVFPVHPRTRARLDDAGLSARLSAAGVLALPPLSYLDFLSLEATAGAVVTDSGGVQEETSALGVPCYTLRRSTERPVTVRLGTNTLLGDDPATLASVRVEGPAPRGGIPRWDGRAGERAADAILDFVDAGAPALHDAPPAVAERT